jgi:hypothetical protein
MENKKINLAIIDNENLIAKLTSVNFARMGAEISVCTNIDKKNIIKSDAVLINFHNGKLQDLLMQIKIIKKDSTLNKKPIIISGVDISEEIKYKLEHLDTYVVLQPIAIEVFWEKIKKILNLAMRSSERLSYSDNKKSFIFRHDKKTHNGKLINISREGFSAIIDKKQPLKKLINATIRLPNNKQAITFVAQIKHCSQVDKHIQNSTIKYIIGAKFKEFITKNSEKTLTEFLTKYKPKDKNIVYYK